MIKTSPLGPGGQPIFKPGFYLQEHSIPQVAQANSHFKDLLGSGGLKRPFNVDEIRWIRNERAMCRINFLYWATRYGFIQDFEEKAIRFPPNLAQKIILDQFAQMEDEEIAILVQVLKARQEGVTTLSELIMLHQAMFVPYKNCLVGSSRPDKSTEMVKKMDFAYSQQPYWLVPTIGTNNSSQIGFDAQRSFIHIRHGAMMSGLGRGATATAFHLSEVTEYQNPDEAIDGALLRAVHDNPNVIGILESTGKGKSGWYYDKWQYNKQYWPLRQSRLCPIFLPWYLLREIYPTESWMRAHPINGEFTEMAVAHAQRAEEYVRSGENKIVTDNLGKDWRMPREQLWFWQVTRQEYESTNKLHIFYQELCADDREAFQSQNASVFKPDRLYELNERCPRPKAVYGLLAPQGEVPSNLQPNHSDIDHSLPYIDIHAKWNPLGTSHDYRLVPLLHRGTAPFDPMGKILIYEFPEPGEFYGLGTDTGFGVGKDRSVIEIIRRGSLARSPAQVGEFVSPNVNSFNLWPFNLAIGTLYSTHYNGKLRQARQVIEGAANGENVFNELKKRGWREFHNWVRYDRKRIIEAVANRQLWYTTSWSRPLLLDMLIDAVDNGWLEIVSPWFVDELGDLEVDEEKMRIAATVGKHDDRVMAIGMALFSLHALDTKFKDSWIVREKLIKSEDLPMFRIYSPGTQGNDTSDVRKDPTSSYRYRVVRSGDRDFEDLKGPGAGLWTPGNA